MFYLLQRQPTWQLCQLKLVCYACWASGGILSVVNHDHSHAKRSGMEKETKMMLINWQICQCHRSLKGQDASPLQGYPPPSSMLLVPISAPGWRETKWSNKSSLFKKTRWWARLEPWTSRSGVQGVNHSAMYMHMPPQKFTHDSKIIFLRFIMNV